MFKFNFEIEKNSDIKEEKSLQSFESIEPSSELSVEGAKDFWNYELIDKYQDYEENYSEYLSEIYNLSEDDFDYDIEISDETKYIMSKFDIEEWCQMTNSEKTDAIDNLSELVSKELGLSCVPSIEYYENDKGILGYYSPETNCIYINTEKTYMDDPKEILNTVIHELKHAFQYERAMRLETKEDALYRCNLENYIDPSKSFYAYQEQFVEVDARAYADAFIKKYEEAMA